MTGICLASLVGDLHLQSLANSAAVFANTYTHIYTRDRLSGTIGRDYMSSDDMSSAEILP